MLNLRCALLFRRPLQRATQVLAASRTSKLACTVRFACTASSAPLPPPPPSPQPGSGFVLGIESSCDDTGVAVVSTSGRVLGESLATQADIHAAWGGVVPKLAQEAHEAAIDGCVEAALAAAGITPAQLDAVAVTIGPGLSLCLRVGLVKARQLAAAHQLPLIPVHHMEAHALVARLGATRFAAEARQQTAQHADAGSGPTPPTAEADDAAAAAGAGGAGGDAVAAAGPSHAALKGKTSADSSSSSRSSGSSASEIAATADELIEFPFLCLLISGGHNLLLVVEGIGQYTQLGTTLDDALGEAYDKVARLLGLDLVPSGGAALEAFAAGGNPRALPLSVPMQRRPTCDFSYAGLKTAVRLAVEEQAPEAKDSNRQLRADIAASFQRVAVQHLEERCRRGVQWAQESHPEVRHLVVAGGVASNQYIRGRLAAVAEAAGLRMVCPPPRLCTDNGVMVAWAGVERLQLGLVEAPPARSDPEEGEWLDLRPRWPLTDRKDPRSFTAPRSAQKKRIFTSLTRLMEQQGQQQQHEQQQEEEPGLAGEEAAQEGVAL